MSAFTCRNCNRKINFINALFVSSLKDVKCGNCGHFNTPNQKQVRTLGGFTGGLSAGSMTIVGLIVGEQSGFLSAALAIICTGIVAFIVGSFVTYHRLRFND